MKKILWVLSVIGGILLGGALVYFYPAQTGQKLGFRAPDAITILNGVTSNVSSTITTNVKDFQDTVCSIEWDKVGTGNVSSTVRFLGSIQLTPPTFTAAQSSTNQWEFLGFTDMKSLSNIAGNTGIAASTTVDHRMVKIDTKYINWITAQIVTTTQNSANVDPVTVVCIKSNPWMH